MPARVVLESAAPGTEVTVLEQQKVTDPNASMRFSAVVDLKVARPGPLRRTPQRDINFDAELACIVIRQRDAAGNDLGTTASLGVARQGQHRLGVEAAPLPGAVEAVLECRLVGLTGKAVFSEFQWEAEAARLYDPALARRVVEPGRAPGFEVDGRLVPPLMVHGQNLETSTDASASLDDLRLPYQYGLRLFSFNAWFPGVTAQDTSANLEVLAAAYPEAWFMIRVWLGPREIFFQDYPGERQEMDDGSHAVNMASPTSEVWRRYVAASIKRLVLELRKNPAATRIAGIIPMYYVTGEWQLGDAEAPYRPGSQDWRMNGFGESHRSAFADWAVVGYGGLDGLNAAWGTHFKSPGEIPVPTVAGREEGSWHSLRDPARQAIVTAHSRFLSESVSGAIIWSSKMFREAFGGRVVTGPFYGHILEHAWSATGVQQQGHLGIGRILRSPAIDFHGSPYSYSNDSRFPGLPLATNAILDSASLHGKAAFLEEDTYTHVAKPPEGFIAPGAHQKTGSLQETLEVLHRNLGASLARGYIHYWMGLLQDGRFNLPEIWESYQPVFDWLCGQPLRPAYRPQVGLVIDENAIPLLAEGDRAVTARWLFELRNILGRVDTTLGIYLQSDLDRIPDSVRCLILATPYMLTDEDRDILRRRWMRDGRVIVFSQFPDVFTATGKNPVPGAITGMKLKMLDQTGQPTSRITGDGLFSPWSGEVIGEPVDRAVLFWRNRDLSPLGPLVVIDDPQAVALARYENLPGQPVSVALKNQDDWISVVTGVHSLTPAMWRELVRAGGGHLYLDSLSEDFARPDVIEATDDFVMVISGRDGGRVLTLPEPGALLSLDTRDAQPSATSDSHKLEFQAGKPRLFRIR